MHLQCHPTVLFKTTWPYLGKEGLDDQLQQGFAEELVKPLMDKIAWICSQSETKYGAGPLGQTLSGVSPGFATLALRVSGNHG